MKSAVETTEMIWLEVTEMNRAKNCAKNFNSFSRTEKFDDDESEESRKIPE